MTPEFWQGKKVFVTGHTGFKGGWLCLLLRQLGSTVHGYSLAPPTVPNLFTLAHVGDCLDHQIGDVRDLLILTAAIKAFKPDIVLHLAAQALLRPSYETPLDTYSTNVMGTVNVLEAARQTNVPVTLIITSDKCYENRETIWPYRETDPMGGYDPYSSSKGCAELVVSAYGRSYFTDGHKTLASVRAGNVIGGGDWARDRLMTDVIYALMNNKRPIIRRPKSIRPWQHVLEPLSGYLRAAEYMWQFKPRSPQAWNFGPNAEGEAPVAEVANDVCRLWGQSSGIEIIEDPNAVHEAGLLQLDSTKARHELQWRPRWPLPKALAMLVEWFKKYEAKADMNAVTLEQIAAYRKEGEPTVSPQTQTLRAAGKRA